MKFPETKIGEAATQAKDWLSRESQRSDIQGAEDKPLAAWVAAKTPVAPPPPQVVKPPPVVARPPQAVPPKVPVPPPVRPAFKLPTRRKF